MSDEKNTNNGGDSSASDYAAIIDDAKQAIVEAQKKIADVKNKLAQIDLDYAKMIVKHNGEILKLAKDITEEKQKKED